MDDGALRLADIGLDWHNPSDFGDAADFVRRTVKQRLREAAVRPKAGQTVQVAIHYLLTSTISLHSRVHTEVASHVTFTDALYALAAKAVARLKAKTGMPAFNGVHLRIEDDFSHVKDAGAGCKHSTSSRAGTAKPLTGFGAPRRPPRAAATLHRSIWQSPARLVATNVYRFWNL